MRPAVSDQPGKALSAFWNLQATMHGKEAKPGLDVGMEESLTHEVAEAAESSTRLMVSPITACFTFGADQGQGQHIAEVELQPKKKHQSSQGK